MALNLTERQLDQVIEYLFIFISQAGIDPSDTRKALSWVAEHRDEIPSTHPPIRDFLEAKIITDKQSRIARLRAEADKLEGEL